jgi:hypothetical protein
MLHNHAFTVGTTSYDLTLANQFYPRESKTAVKQLGKRDYNSDFRYIHYGFTFPVGGVGTWFGVSASWMGRRDDEPGSTVVYQMINELSLIQKQVSFTCVRLTNILIGDKVKFKAQSSREIEGLVVFSKFVALFESRLSKKTLNDILLPVLKEAASGKKDGPQVLAMMRSVLPVTGDDTDH